MEINRVYLSTVGSTNNWAKEHANELDVNALTVITAEEQTAGRGRFKRVWVSPKGCNLYVTYVFFLKNIKKEIGNLPQVLALAAHHSMQAFSMKVKIKWPNDLVIENKKLGGILCEIAESQNQHAIVIGLGVNINMPLDLLKMIDRPATSLREEVGYPLDKERLSGEIHQCFLNYLEKFLKEGFNPFLEDFKGALLHKKGDKLRFSDFSQIIEGHFHAINEDGSLALLHSNGLKNYSSGELL